MGNYEFSGPVAKSLKKKNLKEKHMTANKEKLFGQFPPVSTAEWKEKVIADLKGADFDKKLVWRTNEGFNVQPMYRAEDIENLKEAGFIGSPHPNYPLCAARISCEEPP